MPSKGKNEARKAKEEILLPTHSRTSQANTLYRDQTVAKCIACSRLSDSGEDAKEWGRRERGRYAKRWRNRKKEKGKKALSSRFFFLFSCSRFLSAADPTISEPGQDVRPLALYSQTVPKKLVD